MYWSQLVLDTNFIENICSFVSQQIAQVKVVTGQIYSRCYPPRDYALIIGTGNKILRILKSNGMVYPV